MESAYYLKFNSNKGLYAISKLKEINKGNLQDCCFYSHVYLDLLFQSIGMIINRFSPQNQARENLKLQSKTNIKEYNYYECYYPLLHNKDFRNFIEHIDERDEFLIDNNLFNGTFNLIYPNMDEKLKIELISDDKIQNNLLDLENFKYTILDRGILKEIDLNELEKELKEINRISCSIWGYLMNPL